MPVFTQSAKGRNTVVKNRIIHAKTDDTFEEIFDAISSEASFELQPRISVCVQVAAGITDVEFEVEITETIAFASEIVNVKCIKYHKLFWWMKKLMAKLWKIHSITKEMHSEYLWDHIIPVKNFSH